MKDITQFILESQDKYFSKKEIDTIIKDIKAKDGLFIEFVDDKVNQNLSWIAAYDDYFNRCADDDRCLAELSSYISELLGRDNFSLEQVQKFNHDELQNLF